MVSPNSSTDDASSGSMEDNEKRFYNKIAPVRHAPPTSASESESESESENGTPVLSSPPQKQPQPIPTSKNVAGSVTQKPSNSAKRPREEEQSRSLEKSKKAKEVKKTLPLETPKTSEKKPSEEKKRVDSPTTSAKKNGHAWNTHDEIEFLKGVVAYQVSKGLPKTNMTPVYEYIKNLNLLEHEYSSTQMSDKLRRLKNKFAGHVGDITFKTPHDEAIYKLSKRLWGGGEQDEEESSDEEDEEESSDEEDEKNGDEGMEEDEKKGKGQDVEMAEKENEEDEDEDEEEEEDEDEEEDEVVREGNLASNGALKQVKQSNSKEKRNPSFVPDVVLNNGSTRGVGKLFDLLFEKNLAMMNEIKHDLARENQKFKEEIKEMVREALRRKVSIGTNDSVQFSGDEMRISSSKESPKLEKAEADRFEHKWQIQHFIELDAASKRLQVLQEECQFRMEKLRKEKLGPLVKEENP